MSTTSFHCPECSKALRAKNRSLVGRTIKCPACGVKILIELNEEGSILPRIKGKLASTPSEPDSPETTPASEFQFPQLPGQREARKRMVIIGGISALVFISLLLIVFLGGERETETGVAVADNDAGHSESVSAEEAALVEKTVSVRLRETQFQQQASAIKIFLDARGVFPAPWNDSELSPEQSLSWIASLEAQGDPDRLPPAWDRPWNDPLNDHFVRRSLPRFLNPAIPQKASPDRYPATHFVGIAGVGRDAAGLPQSDPRAGMFGWKRSVSVADVADGLSNTWMISGVQANFGAWAGGGEATVRGVGDGELIGGPEGFGIGDNHSMPILMADGSVRELSSQTDREVVRALATLHNHTPLLADDRHNDQTSALTEHVPPLVAPKPEPPSIEELLSQLQAELKTEPEPVDVEKQLAQKLVLFEQPQELPLSTILREFEEIAGVQIVIEKEHLGEYFSRLDRRLRLSLSEPTLKTVLEKLLEQGGLWYRVDDGKIIVTPDAPLSP